MDEFNLNVQKNIEFDLRLNSSLALLKQLSVCQKSIDTASENIKEIEKQIEHLEKISLISLCGALVYFIFLEITNQYLFISLLLLAGPNALLIKEKIHKHLFWSRFSELIYQQDLMVVELQKFTDVGFRPDKDYFDRMVRAEVESEIRADIQKKLDGLVSVSKRMTASDA